MDYDEMGIGQRKRSNWWFLLPIFLQVVGGLIAYFVIRGEDPRKARNCLYLGIALTVANIAVGLIAESFILSMFGPGW